MILSVVYFQRPARSPSTSWVSYSDKDLEGSPPELEKEGTNVMIAKSSSPRLLQREQKEGSWLLSSWAQILHGTVENIRDEFVSNTSIGSIEIVNSIRDEFVSNTSHQLN